MKKISVLIVVSIFSLVVISESFAQVEWEVNTTECTIPKLLRP